LKPCSLWQPLPFTTALPEWCKGYPELTEALLYLDENDIARYAVESDALITFLSAYIPELAAISQLIELPVAEAKPKHIKPRLHAGIPGRKWLQIKSLLASVDNPQQAVTEWCGGKGYLGRLLATQWQQPVTTLEYNLVLVVSVRKLAFKFNLSQQFVTVDVVSGPVSEYLKCSHPIALHACGDLHRELLRGIIRVKAPGFTIVPCCYHLGRDQLYRAFNSGLKLKLSRDTLRLAVNETVTAHNSEIAKRDQDMAWKLAFLQLREELTGSSDYHPFKPVPKSWLDCSFEGYCCKLAEREKLPLPDKMDWKRYEAIGGLRHFEVVRLQLLRHCFKRVLELWLIMDMAVYLQANGYSVNVHTFCDRELTPRNILIEGKIKQLN